jgi:diadenosine tetraphosphate (Ap4A) HIT family hydrolase
MITSAGPAATQTIKHLHVHYVPRHAGDGLSLPWTNQNAEPLDSALGRCQALLQCHRETGHAGGHEAREENTDA